MVRAQCIYSVRARDRKWVLFLLFFFFALKSDEHPMRPMLLVAMWCKCDIMRAPTRDPGPTPSVGHVTGGMKQRESNETPD